MFAWVETPHSDFPGSHELENHVSTEETRAPQPTTQSNLMSDHTENFIPIGERISNDSSAYDDVRGYTLECRISKRVMKLERHLDLKDQETDGAVHWKSMGPKLRHAFQKEGGYTFSDSQWLERIWKGSNRWKEFLYHRGCSFNVNPILQTGPTAGGKDTKEGDKESEEELNNDLSRPRKAYFYSKWKPHEDALQWIHLASAQEEAIGVLADKVTPLLFTIQCQLIASKKWYPREETKLGIRDFPHLGPLRR